MGQSKNRQVMANLEPTIHDIFLSLVDKEETTVSAYIRGLVISDLKAKGLLTSELMERILTGRSSNFVAAD